MVRNIIKNILAIAVAIIAFAVALTGCAGQSTDTLIADAEQAYTDGELIRSRQIATDVFNKGLDTLSEQQLGRLAILFMKLSETDNSDEDIADATQCFRQAWKISTDSMRSFMTSLPPDELPQFVMLLRIGGSIDSPPDLSEEHYAADSIHSPAEEEVEEAGAK